MNRQKLPRIILWIGILFLLYSAFSNIMDKDFWKLLVDLEFIGIGMYILYIYPKRRLKLNSDLLIIMFFHFGALAINSLLTKNWIIMIISLGFCLGYIVYRIYQKKHKYRFIIHR